eukprot:12936917-Ditylum_brightwellii.AAC.1
MSMSFGWTAWDDRNQQLATCAAPVYGAKPSSFCAEAYVMLSGIRFVHHLEKFMGTKFTWQIEYYADNEGLISCDNSQLSYKWDYPSNTLESDWDVVNQIAPTLKTSEGRYSVEHIKGHQDNKCAYEELDGKSQQNVDAATLAGSFLSENPQFHPLVPHIASNPIELNIKGITINS